MDLTVWLFSYGTLQLPQIQLALFGREVAGEPDALTGFVLDSIAIADPDVVAASGIAVHRILRRGTNQSVPIPGIALAITTADLPSVDAYEGENYARIEISLASGRRAFVYVASEDPVPE